MADGNEFQSVQVEESSSQGATISKALQDIYLIVITSVSGAGKIFYLANI